MSDLEGFSVFGEPGGFVHRNGPIYIRANGHKPALKMLLGPEHVNRLDIASGGLLMTVLDIALGTTVSAAVGYEGICPTVQLNCNLVSSARKGDWLHGEAEVTQETRSLAFATGRLLVGDRTIATASGVFKIPSFVREGQDKSGARVQSSRPS
jgi:acyl-coenzyme A thioesterase PaaI-like protein